jgi:hypothetical protein
VLSTETHWSVFGDRTTRPTSGSGGADSGSRVTATSASCPDSGSRVSASPALTPLDDAPLPSSLVASVGAAVAPSLSLSSPPPLLPPPPPSPPLFDELILERSAKSLPL